MIDVLSGLSQHPKRISPKYFYNQKGSELFNAITLLPEYYLTRAELEILQTHRDSITQEVGKDTCLIEYGSGSSRKVRMLLEALQPTAYLPVDISKEHLLYEARSMHDDFPRLRVYPVCADFTAPLELPLEVTALTKTAFFPGSSIGNFERDAAAIFLKSVSTVVGKDGCLLLGVDKRKSQHVLNDAYNDTKGITAAFNLNVLNHINEAIGSNFDVAAFEHFAHYETDVGRMEMHLVCRKRQSVQIHGQTIELENNERIHTENSYKYSEDELHQLAQNSNMQCTRIWQDQRERFMVALLRSHT